MSKIRPANTTVLLEKRLADVENAAAPDLWELIGLQDEFARVERKWVDQIAAGNDRRQPGDPAKLDKWFERLARQMDRALRSLPSDANDPALPMLMAARDKVAARSSGD